MLHDLSPLFIGSATGFAVEDKLRGIRRKAKALKLCQRQRKELGGAFQLGDRIHNALGAKVGSQRESQHRQPVFIDLRVGIAWSRA